MLQNNYLRFLFLGLSQLQINNTVRKNIINIDWHYYKKVQLLWKINFNPKAGSKLDIHESDRDFKCEFRSCHMEKL